MQDLIKDKILLKKFFQQKIDQRQSLILFDFVASKKFAIDFFSVERTKALHHHLNISNIANSWFNNIF